MSRLTNALLNGAAYANGSTQPMIDLAYGGQNGWSPVLTEWASNQAYVRRQLICVLLEAPGFFQMMPNPEQWVQSLKALVELQAKTIEGFNGGLTVELDEHAVGGAGEFQQEFTDVKRARTEPVFTFVEKAGMPITNLLYNWITYGMMDPDTKTALVGTLGTPPTDLLPDWYSMSCLFFEPDPTHTRVMKAWVTTNMFPKTTGEIIGKRDLTAASEVTNLTVEFTGLSQFNLGTKTFAQSILDSINIANANPYLRPAFLQGLSADVAAVSDDGYAAGSDVLSNIAEVGAAKIA